MFALPGNSFSSNFLLAWSQLLIASQQKGIDLVLAPGVSSFVSFARAKSFGYNVMSGEHQLPFQGKIDYDYIMCIDSDMVFNPDMFFALLESPHDVTSGLYIMSDNKHFTAVRDWDLDFFAKNGTFQFLTPQDVESWKAAPAEPANRYMQVTYNGLGWTLIKKGVLEKLNYPPFWRPLHRVPAAIAGSPDIVDQSSEDVALFLNLRDAGVKCYIDTTIRAGHEKTVVL